MAIRIILLILFSFALGCAESDSPESTANTVPSDPFIEGPYCGSSSAEIIDSWKDFASNDHVVFKPDCSFSALNCDIKGSYEILSDSEILLDVESIVEECGGAREHVCRYTLSSGGSRMILICDEIELSVSLRRFFE